MSGLKSCGGNCHRYGSSWRSAKPPSVPSGVPALLLHRQELPLSKGKALLTRGQPQVSSAVCAPSQRSPSSAHTGSCGSGCSGAAESRVGTVAEPECGFDTSGVWVWRVVYACNALNSNTCHLITEVVTVQNFWDYSEHLLLQAESQLSIGIIFCNLEPFI